MENNIGYTIEMLDEMEGHEFEYACAELLRHNGWRDIEVTQGAGDYGIDILARNGTNKYAIQCKRWNANVGVKALQEAVSGCEYYHCDMAAVMTNSTFTKQAENLSKTTGVRLWGRNHLIKLIDGWDEEYDTISPPIIGKSTEITNNISKHTTKKGNKIDYRKIPITTSVSTKIQPNRQNIVKKPTNQSVNSKPTMWKKCLWFLGVLYALCFISFMLMISIALLKGYNFAEILNFFSEFR